MLTHSNKMVKLVVEYIVHYILNDIADVIIYLKKTA